MRRSALIGVVPAIALIACDEGPTQPAIRPPTIASAAVAPGAFNVLSASVSVRVADAESVAVRFHPFGETTGDSVTPTVSVSDSSATIPVLGLHADRRYVMRVVAFGAGGATVGDSLELRTAALPLDLPRFVAGGADATPGFVLFSMGRYALVIDNDGRVVWYRRFEEGAGLAFLAQPTGHYTVRPLTAAPDDVEPWLQLDATGQTLLGRSCAHDLRPRLHDILLEPDGGHILLCDETQTMDLTALGGNSAAKVTGTVVQRLSADGTLLFEWSPFEHFALDDLAPQDRLGPSVNWTHGNAIERDADGNLLISSRSLNEVTKIDAVTGEVIWRLGGLRNEFTFVGAAAPPFARQHGVRVAAPGTLVLLDNRGDPFESRAERWQVDAATRTATLVQSYGSVPGVVTEIGGSVQPLENGRTLVSFGTAGRVEEFDASGRVMWRIEGNPGYVFRAQRIRSLYAPGVGTPR